MEQNWQCLAGSVWYVLSRIGQGHRDTVLEVGVLKDHTPAFWVCPLLHPGVAPLSLDRAAQMYKEHMVSRSSLFTHTSFHSLLMPVWLLRTNNLAWVLFLQTCI